MEIIQPKFDELAPALSDLEECGEAILDRAAVAAAARDAAEVAAYYGTLVEAGVPEKTAKCLTRDWVEMAWASEG